MNATRQPAQTFTLATASQTVSFTLHGAGVAVLRTFGAGTRAHYRPFLTLAEARAEYRRLLAEGWYVW